MLVVPPASPGICLLVAALPVGPQGCAMATNFNVLTTADGELLATHTESVTATRDCQQPLARGAAAHTAFCNADHRSGRTAHYNSNRTAAGRQQVVGSSAGSFVAAAAVAGRLATSRCADSVQLLRMPAYERCVLP